MNDCHGSPCAGAGDYFTLTPAIERGDRLAVTVRPEEAERITPAFYGYAVQETHRLYR